MLSYKLVREQHPLQQGLRLDSALINVLHSNVREQHPLQQGLRQARNGFIECQLDSQRTASITTRIKTQRTRVRALREILSQRTASITTRIKTYLCKPLVTTDSSQRTASITTRIKTPWSAS